MKASFITAFFFVLFAVPVMASNLDPLPQIKSLPLETYTAQSKIFEKEFMGNSYADFKVVLPSEFIEKSDEQLKFLEQDGYLTGEIFNAFGAAQGGMRPYFSVRLEKLEREISIKNWFITQILRNGQTLKGMEVSDDGNELSAFYIKFNDRGETEVSRLKAFLNNGLYMIAEYVVPAYQWEKEHDRQIYAINSFELQNRNENTVIEQKRSYNYLDAISLSYPVSWRISREASYEPNVHNVSLSTGDQDGFKLADIKISLISSRALADIKNETFYPVRLVKTIEDQRQVIKDYGYEYDELLESRKYDLRLKPKLQVTEIYPLRKKKAEVFVNQSEYPVTHEFWMTVIKGANDGQDNYVMTMLCPSRQENFYNWALAAKAYEVIIESLE